MRAHVLAASAAAALALSCSSSSSPPPAGPPASATRSDVVLRAGSVAADGTTPATVTVTVRDADGKTLAGAAVAIAYAGTATVTPVAPTTDARGDARFEIKAQTPTAGAVTASVGSAVLADAPTLTFHGCEHGTFVNGACIPPPLVLLPPADASSWGGVKPRSFAIADLDGNGLDDVVVADPEGKAVQVLVSYGDGRFAPRARYEAGAQVHGVVAADVDGDAIVDVVTAVDVSGLGTALVVLAGTGDGTLRAPASGPPGEPVTLHGAADLDGDGDPDLVAHATNGVGVLLNQGGTFGPLAKFTQGTESPWAMALADLNSDGALDVASAYWNANEVEVRLGSGDGTFGAAARFAAGVKPGAIAVGDLDGDGTGDLVTANWGDAASASDPGTVSVLLGNGDGSFGPQAEFATGQNPASVAVADLDGDAQPEVVTADANGGTVSVLAGLGAGALGAPVAYDVATIPWRVAVAQLDPDPAPDLVVLDTASGTVSGILTRAGKPSVPPAPPFSRLPHEVAAADLDGDGLTDVVAVTGFSQEITVARGRGDGTFLPPRTVRVDGDPSGGRAVAAGDLDADGRAEVVVLTTNSSTASVLVAQADGTLAVDATYPVGNGPAAAVVGDLDGDGDGDLVVANAFGGGTVSVLLRSADGTLAPQAQFAAGGFPRSVALGNLDPDGFPDLVVAGAFPWEIRVLRGDGAGGFAAPVAYAAGSSSDRGAPSVALADLDVDGDLDAVAADPGGGAVGVFLGNGDGTFAERTRYGVGASPRSVAIGDVNGDGALDAITVDLDSFTVTFLAGNGDGSFAEGRSYVGFDQPHQGVLANVNRDDLADVVVADWGNSWIRVLAGTPAGLDGATPVLMGPRPSAVAAADLDRDGDVDLVSASYEAHTLAVALGRGGGAFGRSVLYDVAGYPTGLAIGDVNADGIDDLVLAHALTYPETHGEVGVLLGNGDGSFGAEATSPAGVQASSLALGDVTGDGLVDAVVADVGSALLLPGNGDGTFGAPVGLATAPPPEALIPPFPPGAAPIDVPPCVAVALGDVDGDGALDVLAANSSVLVSGGLRIDEVAVLLGNGDGTFRPRSAYPVVLPVSVLLADLDGDGDLDGVAASNQTISTRLLGNGDGTFATGELPLAMGGVYVAAGDLDRDGDADLVSSSGFPALAVHRNDGAGGFTSATYRVPGAVRDLAVADLDGDGHADVALLSVSGVFPLISGAP